MEILLMLNPQWQPDFLAVLPTLTAAKPIPAIKLDPTDPIPAVLVDTEEIEGTPKLLSSIYSAIAIPNATSDPRLTTVSITHSRGCFVGDAELVVWLDTDERASVWIPSVEITDGKPFLVEVESGIYWHWRSVRFAWTRLFSVS